MKSNTETDHYPVDFNPTYERIVRAQSKKKAKKVKRIYSVNEVFTKMREYREMKP